MRRVGMMGPRPRTTLWLLAGLVVVGIGAQLAGTTRGWLADLLGGLAVGFSGAVVVGRRPRDPIGWLLIVASALWFAGTLASSAGALGSLGRELQFAHRGPLLMMLVAPIWDSRLLSGAGRWMSAASLAVVAGACAVSIGPWVSPEALAVVAGLSGSVAIAELAGGVVVPRPGLWVAALPATALWVSAATVSLRLGELDPDTRLLGYQLGVAGAAVAMGASRIGRRTVDEILDVGRRGGLGGALGDPSVRIGFDAPDGTFRAVDGSPVVPVGSQTSTDIDLGAAGRARFVHGKGLLEDARIRSDVELAARLLAEHYRLTTEVQHHASSVSASRARLIAAEDRASAAFAAELGRRVLPHLDCVIGALSPAPLGAPDQRALATAVRSELAGLAAGAVPSQLGGGLASALQAMARDASITVELSLDDIDLSEEQARTLYFAASEALSNAIKHSEASIVAIRLTRLEDGCELTIDDDGAGAIAIRPGGGLMGLSDRLAAAGGTLGCTRSSLGGASVMARLPRPTRSGQPIGTHTGIVHRSV